MTLIECNELIKYIDDNNSGDIDFSEFIDKMNLNVKK